MLGGGFVPGSSEAGVFALLELLADPKAVKERLSQLKDAQKPLDAARVAAEKAQASAERDLAAAMKERDDATSTLSRAERIQEANLKNATDLKVKADALALKEKEISAAVSELENRRSELLKAQEEFQRSSVGITAREKNLDEREAKVDLLRQTLEDKLKKLKSLAA